MAAGGAWAVGCGQIAIYSGTALAKQKPNLTLQIDGSICLVLSAAF
jgi:hypothetical protein